MVARRGMLIGVLVNGAGAYRATTLRAMAHSATWPTARAFGAASEPLANCAAAPGMRWTDTCISGKPFLDRNTAQGTRGFISASGNHSDGKASSEAASMGRHRLAIIGGAGPDAGVDVFNKILKENKEQIERGTGPIGTPKEYLSDRDAPYIVLFQVPGLGGPRGERDLLEKGGAPYKLVWNSFQDTLDSLLKIGINKFVISCNTLHMLEDAVRKHLKHIDPHQALEFVSMIKCVEEGLLKKERTYSEKETTSPVKAAIFGSFATTDVTGMSPFRRLSAQKNLEVLELPLQTRKELQDLIGTLKRSDVSDPATKRACALTLIDLARDVEEDAKIVLACTEFPLLLESIRELDGDLYPRLVDPGTLAARKMLE